MKADRDDAPYYLRTSRGAGNISKWLIAGLIGTSITAGLLYLAGAKILILQDATPVAQIEQPQEESAYLPPFEEPDPTQPTAEEGRTGSYWERRRW